MVLIRRVNGAYLGPEDRGAFAPKARGVPARGKSAGSGATADAAPGNQPKRPGRSARAAVGGLSRTRAGPPTFVS